MRRNMKMRSIHCRLSCKVIRRASTSMTPLTFIASSYDKTNRVNEALQYYSKVVQQNRSTFVAAAAQRSAELEIGRGNFNNAVTNFRVLSRNAESKKEQTQLPGSGLMDTYYTLKSYDSTLYYAKEDHQCGQCDSGQPG
jgi:hypothetical protein